MARWMGCVGFFFFFKDGKTSPAPQLNPSTLTDLTKKRVVSSVRPYKSFHCAWPCCCSVNPTLLGKQLAGQTWLCCRLASWTQSIPSLLLCAKKTLCWWRGLFRWGRKLSEGSARGHQGRPKSEICCCCSTMSFESLGGHLGLVVDKEEAVGVSHFWLSFEKICLRLYSIFQKIIQITKG